MAQFIQLRHKLRKKVAQLMFICATTSLLKLKQVLSYLILAHKVKISIIFNLETSDLNQATPTA